MANGIENMKNNFKHVKLIKSIEANGNTYEAYSCVDTVHTLNWNWVSKKHWDVFINGEAPENYFDNQLWSDAAAIAELEKQVEKDNLIAETKSKLMREIMALGIDINELYKG